MHQLEAYDQLLQEELLEAQQAGTCIQAVDYAPYLSGLCATSTMDSSYFRAPLLCALVLYLLLHATLHQLISSEYQMAFNDTHRVVQCMPAFVVNLHHIWPLSGYTML